MLITAGVVIRGHIHVEEVFQLPLQGLERGPVLFILLPAVYHDVVHDFGAVGGARHPVALRNLLDHLVVAHGWNSHRGTLSQLEQQRFLLSNISVGGFENKLHRHKHPLHVLNLNVQ